MANFKNPNPVIPVEVLFNRYDIEPGEVVRVIHSGLPDVQNGTMGWDRYMAVVGKRVMWDTGTLELELIDTVYGGSRYGVIAPEFGELYYTDPLDNEHYELFGSEDYGDAIKAKRDRYAYISASATGNKMSDGTDGYVIM